MDKRYSSIVETTCGEEIENDKSETMQPRRKNPKQAHLQKEINTIVFFPVPVVSPACLSSGRTIPFLMAAN